MTALAVAAPARSATSPSSPTCVPRLTAPSVGLTVVNPETVAFVASTDPQKRSKLVDQLLSAPEWVDKWTMFYGDLFKNTDNQPSTALRRFPQGRNAFYKWIHDSLANGKPYNQMATELISTADPNSYNNTTSLTTYDSLGAAHTATLYFIKGAAANSWNTQLYVDGNAVGTPQALTYSNTGALTAPATQRGHRWARCSCLR